LQQIPSRRRPRNDSSEKSTTENEFEAKADVAHCDTTIIIIVDAGDDGSKVRSSFRFFEKIAISLFL
jgi:hypothetical protein